MRYITLVICTLWSTGALAWDGWDYEAGSAVEIDKGNLVRDGETIEYFDYDSGSYRSGTVQEIDRTGSSVDVDIIDDETGESRTFEMDD